MSEAWYFVQNLANKEVINLMCYSTREPHLLTDAQKLTRLYKYTHYQVNAKILIPR